MEGPPSDETMLAGVAERDIGAFRALYERHSGWLALRLARRCNDRDLVLDRGKVRYDGQVTELVRQAAGRVWLADEPDPAATVSWRTGTGRYRNVAAHAGGGVDHVEPFLEDAYLLLRGRPPGSQQAKEVAS